MRTLFLAVGLVALTGCGQKSSDEHLVAARQFVQQQKLESAVVELKNAVQQDPQSAEARFELGRVYLAQKKFESAEKELNRALQNGYAPAKVIPLLSQAYQKTGAHAALSEINHTESGMTAEQEMEVGFFKLQSLVQLNKPEDASKLIEELKQNEVQSVYRGLVNVYELMVNEQPEQALQSIEALHQDYPKNVDLLKLQGQLYLRNQQPERAAQVFQSYLEQYPDDHQVTFMLANLLVDSGNVVQAEPYVDKLLSINEENGLLNQLKAVISAGKEEHEKAQMYAEKAIKRGRSAPILRLIAGHAAYLQQDYESANRHLSYIASSLPENHPGLKMLAASQLELGLSDDASKVLSNIDELSESDALLFSKTGYELIRSGNIKEAEQVIERSAQLSTSAEDLTRLGVLRLSVNDLSGIVDLEKALEKSPDMDVTKATLANAYIVTNQLDKAEQLAQEWQTSDPEDFRAYMLAGEVKAKQEDYAGALAQFQQADSLEPENGIVKLAIANLDFLQGDYAPGEQKVLAILDKKPDFVPALAAYYVAKKSQGEGEAGLQPAIKAKQARPDNVALTMMLSRMYLSQQMWENALSTVNEIPENDDTPQVYWVVKGQALMQLGKIDQAEDHYAKWLRKSPNNKQANVGMLLMLDAQNKFSDGVKRTDAFLQKRDDIEVQVLNVHFLLMSQQLEKAQAAYDALPEQLHELPIVKGFKARLLYAQGEVEAALPLAQVAYEGIANSRNLALLVACLERINEAEQAKVLLQEHVKAVPTDLVAKMMLAERQISGESQAAINTYKESLKLNPNNFVVLNNLAYLLSESGLVDDAEDFARQAVALRPENPDALDTLAQVLVKQGNHEEALKFYDRAVNDEMKNEEIYLNYVDALLASGKQALGKRKLEARKFEQQNSIERVKALKQEYGI